ncbi:ATP-dependent DNA helicase RecG [Candidatus Uhrbacteria bacterium]|nr:ATP-dependent DNA helicase RecG [Candidatus Uhrbacteria bacterium]
MTLLKLSSPVSDISHVARGVTAQLKHLKILTVEDLLFYFPARYDDLSCITPLGQVKVGERAVVRGRVELIESARSRWRKKLLTQAVVADASGQARVVWFNQPWIAKMFKKGDEVYLVGELKDDGSGAYFSSPAYERVSRQAATHVARIVPVYPSTEKLSQKQLRFLVKNILPLARVVVDSLPADIRSQYQLVNLAEALTQVHFPVNQILLDKARLRLKFDELFRLQLFAASLKRELKKIPAPRVEFQEESTKKFVDILPFKLTDDQRKAAWEILQDLTRARPMNRLLEGDVGAGKTVVVAIAALNVAKAGGQTVIMAPTEILARQHFNTFTKLFTPFGVRVELRVGSEKKKTVALDAEVVVGTHALIQKGVEFKNLALTVVDEQHRFGVSQRAALKEKRGDGKMPHLLSLTATPIPRSLALVFYGDLDISILREMPMGRKKIETRVILPSGLKEAYEFVRAQVRAGHQVFWTCPIIDSSDVLGVKAATEVVEHLKNEVFTDLRVGLLHGRMKSKEREKTTSEFLEKKIDILVATPVIEVGIDVPNAAVMVIEGSERFGLAQLHQFRGRVGRGDAQSYCLLMIEDGKAVNARMQEFLKSNDGFELAERDLELRGPGEIYGQAQSGFPEFKIATFGDVELAKQAKQAAEAVLAQDPELTHFPVLKAQIMAREGKAHLE